jgi:hypothetical protein
MIADKIWSSQRLERWEKLSYITSRTIEWRLIVNALCFVDND